MFASSSCSDGVTALFCSMVIVLQHRDCSDY